MVLQPSKEASGMKKNVFFMAEYFPRCRTHDAFIIHSSTGGCVISCSFPATVGAVWITGMQWLFVVGMESFGYESGVVQLGIWVGVHLFLQF